MRGQYSPILLLLALALLLAGCTASPAPSTPARETTPVQTMFPAAEVPETQPPAPTTAAAEPTLPPVTETPVTQMPAPTEAPVVTEPMADTLPYIQQIHRDDQPIYSGPGYDSDYVRTVQKWGTYTIVEEAYDSEGNLWGRLKSGVGWVDLTQIRSETYRNALLSANYADENLLLHGDYLLYSSGQEYSIPIAFRAYGTLHDVTLYYLELGADGYSPGADFCILPEMTQDMPLVAELAFPGDMTMYGIRFVDETGVTHIYSIYISLRNGALMLTEE